LEPEEMCGFSHRNRIGGRLDHILGGACRVQSLIGLRGRGWIGLECGQGRLINNPTGV
jgi:hypothetical protein